MSSFDFNEYNFNDPKYFLRYGAITPTNLGSGDGTDATAAAFFTTSAVKAGAIDTTNWSADTYKTIVNLSNANGGLMSYYLGPTCGATESHTVRITVDGAVYTIVLTTASTKRPGLFAAPYSGDDAIESATTSTEAMNAGKTALVDFNVLSYFPKWSSVYRKQARVLEFRTSLLVEAKQTSAITNSTATAYSAVGYMLFP